MNRQIKKKILIDFNSSAAENFNWAQQTKHDRIKFRKAILNNEKWHELNTPHIETVGFHGASRCFTTLHDASRCPLRKGVERCGSACRSLNNESTVLCNARGMNGSSVSG